MPQREEMSVEEYRQMKKQSKYGNKKIDADGYTFDSLAEHERYKELCLLENAGAISDLRVHPRYELQKPFTDYEGKRHASIYYEADFSYTQDGARIVEDTKGVETPTFKIKRKMFLYKYFDLQLKVIKVKR